MGFFLDGDVLYKKGKDHILLRCVDASETKKIIHEIHEGICGTHASGHIMKRQIMRPDIIGWRWKVIASNMYESVTNVKSIWIRYMFHLRL